MNSQLLEEFSATNFSMLDWGIVAVYMFISLVVGVLVYNLASNMTVFVGAGRRVGTWLGIATMTGTELGLITVMYSAQKGFGGGFAAFHIAVLSGFVAFLVGVSGFIIVPLRRMEVLTIPEFYERRFGRSTRMLGGAILTFAGVLNMGLFLKVGSMFVVGVTGLPPNGVAVAWVMTILLSFVLVYTILGGMISIIITDYIQFVVLSFGLIYVSLAAIYTVGWDNIFGVIEQYKGEAGYSPLVSEGGFGASYVTWMFFLGLVNCAIWPTAIARALAMESTQALKRQYRWTSISFVIRNLLPNFWGIAAFAFFATQAPTLAALFNVDGQGAEVADNLYAMPVFLGRLVPTGLLGLITAAMLAAFMSTNDSYLLCWSSVFVQDVAAPACDASGRTLSDRTRIRLTRISILMIGIFIWAWGLFYEGSDDIWDYMAITGAVYFTGAFALLVGGLYWKGATRQGANAALLAGSTAILGLSPVRHFAVRLYLLVRGTPWADSVDVDSASLLPGPWVGLGTILLTCVVFVTVSLIWKDSHNPSRAT